MAFGGLLFYGFLRENYEEHLKVEKDRNKLQCEQETKEKRAAIGAGLLQLYDNGAKLAREVKNSTDDSPPSVWDDKLLSWRDDVAGYLEDNVSAGKAQYVDGVQSVSAARISGMKSDTTRGDKETIFLHLNERLKRLADVMREY